MGLGTYRLVFANIPGCRPPKRQRCSTPNLSISYTDFKDGLAVLKKYLRYNVINKDPACNPLHLLVYGHNPSLAIVILLIVPVLLSCPLRQGNQNHHQTFIVATTPDIGQRHI